MRDYVFFFMVNYWNFLLEGKFKFLELIYKDRNVYISGRER